MRATIAMLLVLALPSVAAATAGDVDQPGVCYLCHDDVQEQQQLPAVHSAFADGTCSNCHNPHASRHAALLNDDPGELCASCHTDVAEAAGRQFGHSPVARGDCTECHAPHASEHRNQLHLALVDQCSECHEAVGEWMARPVVHAPVAAAECATCHDPHGSDYPALLPGTVTETCLSCHEHDAGMEAAHGNPAIARADCTACHDPHSSARKGLLRANEHGPFAAGSCSTCHGETEQRTSFEVAGVRDLCEKCHTATKQFADFPYHHNLDEPSSCAQCHNPHASNFDALLLNDVPDLCSGCHFVDREKPRAEYMTHDGMDCTECHQPHGADNARYLRTRSSELCTDCHTEAHTASHPVGPEVIDPRTEEPVTCLSCHQLHGADFGKYLPLDPTRDLCLQCHRR